MLKQLDDRLKEANYLKDQCFAFGNLTSWAYWWEQIEFLEAMLDLYKGEQR